MLPRIMAFAFSSSDPFPRVSLETSQVYATSVRGVRFGFEIWKANVEGLPNSKAVGASIRSSKMIGKMTSTNTASTVRIRRSRKNPRKRDQVGGFGDTDFGCVMTSNHRLNPCSSQISNSATETVSKAPGLLWREFGTVGFE